MGSRFSLALAFGAVCVLIVSSGGTASGAPLPCSLLTPSEVSSVVGGTAAAGQPIGDKGCSRTAPGQPPKTVTLVLAGEKEFAVAKTPPTASIKPVPASGIGDEAIYNRMGQLSSLAVRKGKVVFIIRMYGISQDQIEVKEKAIAIAVLPKL